MDNDIFKQFVYKEVNSNSDFLTLGMLDNAIKATKSTEITLHNKGLDVLNNTEEV